MSKNRWESTPFKTIEGAYEFAEAIGLSPTVPSPALVEEGQFRSFTTSSGLLVAQRMPGGPVRQIKVKPEYKPRDPTIPSYEENKMLTGPWAESDYQRLEEVLEHYRKCYLNDTGYKVVALGRILVIRMAKTWYEYLEKKPGDVRVRVLTSCPPWRKENPQVELVPNAITLERNTNEQVEENSL